MSYGLEYGSDSLEVHADAFAPGERVLIVDDVLATGGTARAASELAERLQAAVVGLSFLIELSALRGREQLPGTADPLGPDARIAGLQHKDGPRQDGR